MFNFKFTMYPNNNEKDFTLWLKKYWSIYCASKQKRRIEFMVDYNDCCKNEKYNNCIYNIIFTQ